MSDDLDLEIEIARARAKAKGAPVVQSPTAEPSKLDAAMSWLKSRGESFANDPLAALDPTGFGREVVADPLGSTRAALMGVTYGAAPRMLSGIEAATGRDYNDALAENQKAYNAAEGQHPLPAVAGAIAAPNPIGKWEALGKLAPAARIAANAGLAGVGAALRDEPGGPSALDSGAKGAAWALPVAAGLELIPALGRAAPTLRRWAEEKAIQGAFGGGQITNKMQSINRPDEEAVLKMGREMLDQKLVPFFGSTDAVAKKAMSTEGARIGEAMDAAKATGKPASFWSAARSGEAKMRTPVAADPTIDLNETEEAASAKARAWLQQVENSGGRNLTPEQTWDELARHKRQGWDSVNLKDDAPLASQLHHRAIGGVRDDIERQVGKVAGPDVAADLADANKRFGLAADVHELAKDVDTRGMVYKPKWPTVMAGVLSGATSGAAAGSPGAGFTAAAIPYAAQVIASPNRMARTLDAAAKVAGTLPQRSIGTPAATSAAARKLWEWYGVAPKDDEDISRTHADKQLPGL